jgi:hypothetical protein
MPEYRQVMIEWNDNQGEFYDNQGELYEVTVCVGGEWTEGEDDDDVFFYFSTEDEFEYAKTYHEGEDFRIVTESEETE